MSRPMSPYFARAKADAEKFRDDVITGRTLPFTAAAHVLAKCIYDCRALAFALDADPWDKTDVRAKQLYIRQSQDVLDANRPAENASLRVVPQRDK